MNDPHAGEIREAVRLKPDATTCVGSGFSRIGHVASAVRRTALCALVLVLTATLAAPQGDRGPTEALSRRASDRLESLRQEADRLASEERTLLGDLRKLEIDRQIKNEEFTQTTARAASTARELTAIDEQIARIEQEDLADRPELKTRLVALYKLGQGRYLRMMLSVSDVRRVGQASRVVSSIAARDRERIASYQQRLNTLKTSRATLQTRAAELSALRLDAERARAAADRAIAARNALIANIDSARDLNAQFAGELEMAHQKLQSTLKAVGGTAAAEPVTLPLRPFRGDLDWPVGGRVREPFGKIVNGRPASNGIEIAAAEGTPVRAIHDGTVAFADTFSGFGRLVIIDHGGQAFSLYGNLLDMAVSVGARVAHADVVGTVGALLATSSSAPVAPAAPVASGGDAGLYFELRIDGRPVDPLQWLRKK
jgi:septal ring factor EnvC (AmiA/AmiB activator)